MSSGASQAQPAGIACPKCGRINGSELRKCDQCGTRLYTHCRQCGSRNPRARSRCAQCGHHLHGSSHRHGGDPDATLKLLLVVIVVVALYFLVRWVAAPPGFPSLPPAEPAQ